MDAVDKLNFTREIKKRKKREILIVDLFVIRANNPIPPNIQAIITGKITGSVKGITSKVSLPKMISGSVTMVALLDILRSTIFFYKLFKLLAIHC